MNRVYFIIAFTCLSTCFSAQEIIDGKVVYNYSVKDGLPSNQVLYSLQDSKGFMWFATGGGGVSRFDGQSFETFDITDGLTDNEVFTIHEDGEGRIWFGTYNCQLSYFDNDSIYSYEYNDVIRETIEVQSIISLLHHDEQGYLFLCFVNRAMVRISPNGLVKDYADHALGPQVDVYLSSKMALVSSRLRGWSESDVTLRLHERDKPDCLETEHELQKESNQGFARCFISHSKTDTFLFCNTYIAKINKGCFQDQEFQVPSTFLSSLYVISVFEKDSVFWLLLKNNGIVRGTIGEEGFQVIDHVLKNEFITNITEDSEGGLWLCSHDRGILYIPYPSISSSAKNAVWQKRAKNLVVRNEENMAFAISPSCFVIKHNSRYDTLDLKIKKSDFIRDFAYSELGDSISVCGPGISQIYKISESELELLPIERGLGDTSFQALNGTKVLEGDRYELHKFLQRHGSLPILHLNNWATAYGAVGDGILVGSNAGFEEFTYIDKQWQAKPFPNQDPIYTAFIQDFENYRDGIWIATRGRGIAFYTDSIELVLGLEEGLSTLNLTDLKQDGDTLWVSSDTGLDKLVFDKDMNITWNSTFSSSNGLSSDYVYGVEVSNSAVYVSTELGIDRISRSALGNLSRVDRIQLQRLTLSEVGADSINTLKRVFSYKQNDLEIAFQAIEFRAMGKQAFRYRLDPIHSSWNHTQSNHVVFNDLPPDSYSFAVQVEDIYGRWSSDKEVQFVIHPPIWATWYFRAIAAILFLAAIYFGVKRREKGIHDKFLLEGQVESLREKALRAQVNPHFLFNTLNSIQNFILKEDFEAANKYLTQFSRLIRMILTQSDKELISISDETHMLRMYLKLEQMRFDNAFEFELRVSDNLAGPLTSIPSMMVQPYVENAIWHGLALQNRKGLIEITFAKGKGNRCDSHIECVIRDNGIGRDAAKALQSTNSKTRKAVGMSLTKKRLDVLNGRSTDDIQVIDLRAEDGEAMGTEIRIHLPYLTKDRV